MNKRFIKIDAEHFILSAFETKPKLMFNSNKQNSLYFKMLPISVMTPLIKMVVKSKKNTPKAT